MNRFENLPMPPDEYRIDLLVAGFETAAKSVAEDLQRASGAISAERMNSPLLQGSRPLALADKLMAGAEGGEPADSLASSMACRDARIRLTGNLAQFLDELGDMEVRTFTAIPKGSGWQLQPEQLWVADANRRMYSLRSQLNRKGANHSSGFIVACLHGEFEPFGGNYQLHIHGLVGGDMIEVLEKLRESRLYKSDTIRQRLRLRTLNDPPEQLSYIFQGWWPSRRNGPVGDDGETKRERTKHRIPEPYHTQYLLWLD